MQSGRYNASKQVPATVDHGWRDAMLPGDNRQAQPGRALLNESFP